MAIMDRSLPFLHKATYIPGSFPYLDDGSQPVGRGAWLAIFYESIAYLRSMASRDESVEDAEEKAGVFASTYRAWLDELDTSPLDPSVTYSCLHLCKLREHALRQAGFRDIFREVKKTENANALRLLSGICAELDSLDVASSWQVVVRNILAGNIFDCGSAATRDGMFCFEQSRATLRPRPWVVDDVDAFVEAMTSKRYRKALIFCDNAGGDFVGGILPFARHLLKTNTAANVVIAANTLPALNDMTYDDIVALLPDIYREDGVLEEMVKESKRLRFVPSGSDLPVIDLSGVQNALSPELLAEAHDADFVVLEGMGRAIETNLYARLQGVDSLRIGMVKHEEVARCLGGCLKDCVVKFVEDRGGC